VLIYSKNAASANRRQLPVAFSIQDKKARVFIATLEWRLTIRIRGAESVLRIYWLLS